MITALIVIFIVGLVGYAGREVYRARVGESKVVPVPGHPELRALVARDFTLASPYVKLQREGRFGWQTIDGSWIFPHVWGTVERALNHTLNELVSQNVVAEIKFDKFLASK